MQHQVDARNVFFNCCGSSGRTRIIASEEEDVMVAVEESCSHSYIVVFDPLDGSSNIDAAVSIGLIFGIYSPHNEWLADIYFDSMLDSEEQKCIVSVCHPGSNHLAAGYCDMAKEHIHCVDGGSGEAASRAQILGCLYGQEIEHEETEIMLDALNDVLDDVKAEDETAEFTYQHAFFTSRDVKAIEELTWPSSKGTLLQMRKWIT
uniref:Fructose-1,6-bisphosphatase, chloroplastic n=1 Tax=Tanacetum cinerariifolium TaxID=118510 RepID=A0A6L2MBM8_TANCI|nr:fructose-1,6-bisphosphatase, chloroplastic [Tanacetum cinerariifolium]